MKRRQRVVSEPLANINVTSLLDITFVLLIAFMIVAPALKHGLDLDLPEVRNAPNLNPDKPLSVAVKSGPVMTDIYLEGRPVVLEELAAQIRGIDPDLSRPVTLEGDKRADWESMARVIAELRNGGVTNIGIVTVPAES